MNQYELVKIKTLIITLINSTARYNLARIDNDKGLKAYHELMCLCKAEISIINNVDDLLQYSLHFKQCIEDTRIKPTYCNKATIFNSFKKEIQYARIAAKHINDILQSIATRFITGGTRIYENFPPTIDIYKQIDFPK